MSPLRNRRYGKIIPAEFVKILTNLILDITHIGLLHPSLLIFLNHEYK